jgi:hypothetical protein
VLVSGNILRLPSTYSSVQRPGSLFYEMWVWNINRLLSEASGCLKWNELLACQNSSRLPNALVYWTRLSVRSYVTTTSAVHIINDIGDFYVNDTQTQKFASETGWLELLY